MHRNGISEPYGGFIPSFFLVTLHIVLHSDYTILHSHQWCNTVPFFPYPLQNLLLIDLDDGHSDQSEMISHVVFICIPLITSDVEVFTSLLAICMSTLEKWLFRSSAHFLIF